MHITIRAENDKEIASLEGKKEVVIPDAREYLIMVLAVEDKIKIVHPCYYSGTLDYLFGRISAMYEQFRAAIAKR